MISAADVDQLFEPFRRLQPDRTTHADGWGLGLSIVQAVATAHGGTVRARAREAGGLEIEASIPAMPEAMRSSDRVSEASGNRQSQ